MKIFLVSLVRKRGKYRYLGESALDFFYRIVLKFVRQTGQNQDGWTCFRGRSPLIHPDFLSGYLSLITFSKTRQAFYYVNN